MTLRDRLAHQIAYMNPPRGNHWNLEGAKAIVDTIVLPELREMYGSGFIELEAVADTWPASDDRRVDRKKTDGNGVAVIGREQVMGVILYGASDDLLEIEGDIDEEFSMVEPEQSFIALSDGTLLDVQYDQNGVWRFRLLVQGTAGVTINQAPADDEDNYTDRVTVIPGNGERIKWVGVGIEYHLAKRSTPSSRADES